MNKGKSESPVLFSLSLAVIALCVVNMEHLQLNEVKSN